MSGGQMRNRQLWHVAGELLNHTEMTGKMMNELNMLAKQEQIVKNHKSNNNWQ